MISRKVMPHISSRKLTSPHNLPATPFLQDRLLLDSLEMHSHSSWMVGSNCLLSFLPDLRGDWSILFLLSCYVVLDCRCLFAYHPPCYRHAKHEPFPFFLFVSFFVADLFFWSLGKGDSGVVLSFFSLCMLVTEWLFQYWYMLLLAKNLIIKSSDILGLWGELLFNNIIRWFW